jgi:hypothetical protein
MSILGHFHAESDSQVCWIVVNIRNYVSKFGILGVKIAKPTSQIAYQSNEVLN